MQGHHMTSDAHSVDHITHTTQLLPFFGVRHASEFCVLHKVLTIEGLRQKTAQPTTGMNLQ